MVIRRIPVSEVIGLWKKFDQRKESIILCNSTNKELKRFEYVSEICQYRTKCFKCSALIQRIRNLIDNITVIRKNETLGICDHCIIRYRLSNSEFIDKGWTKLPSIKMMRRTNIYKMVPSYSKFDWFKNHKNEKMLCYGSSEKLAEVYEDGCGKWFYKNGNTALDYYSTAELNLGKRCIIYSSSEENLQNKNSLNVIASFDYFGNGVVYDNSGKVRLKYNQSEGFVIDKTIGPPSHWMWHTLNEPPVLFSTFCDTFVKEKSYSYLKNEEVIDEMSKIEFEKNRLMKEAKLREAYKPFEIRIKVVKINDYFSLRIVDQSKIYIHFRCEHICLKLNVGMFLKNKEIIGSDIAVVSERKIDPFDYPKDA
ncbi:uncharacterized protein LOC124543401 [Vanessa cardui]|uniref:uncharacterized protein LOC124543401 n=1 Tax=Vanessa cardui TaxID=171605 RepID=UPI001F12938A|nr:uncharacterized protein LOC124543401 [Vanessa cardui]